MVVTMQRDIQQPRAALGTVWLHFGRVKEALVVESTATHVGIVYDRVDDPDGPCRQYGVQWFRWTDFYDSHSLQGVAGADSTFAQSS
jgi:hypothetical protein